MKIKIAVLVACAAVAAATIADSTKPDPET